jgi:hypothetical protein
MWLPLVKAWSDAAREAAAQARSASAENKSNSRSLKYEAERHGFREKTGDTTVHPNYTRMQHTNGEVLDINRKGNGEWVHYPSGSDESKGAGNGDQSLREHLAGQGHTRGNSPSERAAAGSKARSESMRSLGMTRTPYGWE